MDNRNRKLLHGMILEWQQPIYNLAYRMLGNEADAADATQDICGECRFEGRPGAP